METGEGRGRSVERDGADDVEEGWDDEMEAAELASFKETLSVSDMEWVEEEEEEGEDQSSVGDKVLETEEGGDDCENREQLSMDKQHWLRSKAPSQLRPQRKYSFIKPHHFGMCPTSKANQRAVKRGGGSAHLATITDSPMPGTRPPRKSSGQSIYKAPGQCETVQPG